MSSTILGSGKKLEDFMLKTEVFDTPGNFTFNHPNPGNALEVSVTLIGGGGGGGATGESNSTDGFDGGDTIWDVSGSPITASGGGGGKNSSNGATGGVANGNFSIPGRAGSASNFNELNLLPDTIYGAGGGGGGTSGTLPDGYSGGGATGERKTINVTIYSDIEITIGNGGSEGLNHTWYTAPKSGKSGAIIVSYAKAAAGFPTVSVTNKPEWEHFGEVAWKTSPDTANLAIAQNSFTDVTLDTEVLDTGNKATLDGGNLFTLQAGTYEIDISVKANGGGADILLSLYNESDSSWEFGENFYSSGETNYKIKGFLNLSTAKQFRLRGMQSGASGGIGQNVPFTLTEAGAESRVRIQFKWRPNS